jgi:hypothetical protein
MQNVFETPGTNSLNEIAYKPLEEMEGGQREVDRELTRNGDHCSYVYDCREVPGQ